MRCRSGSTPASSFPQKLLAKLNATEGPSDTVPGMMPAFTRFVDGLRRVGRRVQQILETVSPDGNGVSEFKKRNVRKFNLNGSVVLNED